MQIGVKITKGQNSVVVADDGKAAERIPSESGTPITALSKIPQVIN